MEDSGRFAADGAVASSRRDVAALLVRDTVPLWKSLVWAIVAEVA